MKCLALASMAMIMGLASAAQATAFVAAPQYTEFCNPIATVSNGISYTKSCYWRSAVYGPENPYFTYDIVSTPVDPQTASTIANTVTPGKTQITKTNAYYWKNDYSDNNTAYITVTEIWWYAK